MVFKADQEEVVTDFADKAVRQIIAAGLTVRVYFSSSGKEIFCEIRAPVERLMQFADQLEKAASAGDPEAGICPIMINDDPDITFRSPYEYIYARYDRKQSLQNLYFKSDGVWHPFRSSVRLSIVVDILKTPMCLGGAGLKVDRLQLEGKILALFPKHRKLSLASPNDRVCVCWLIPLAVAGFVTAMTVYISGNEEHAITLVFAPIVVFWAIFMLEFWKRKEKRVALEWGMSGFETGEQTRPEYKGEFIASPINGKTILYYPTSKKTSKARQATAVIVSMILIVVSCIAAVYAFRWYLVYGTSGSWGRTWGGIITSIINSVQIQILNALYKKIAVSLNDFENHRTSTEYEDSLVIKLFCFTFCNSYGGFIYLAFVGEPVVGVACEKSCMSLLATNLTIVFIVQLLVGNLTEILIPYAHYRMRVRAEERSKIEGDCGKVRRTQAEKGLYLEQYDPIMGTLMDYAELAVQFGYITLFVVAFPLAPFLALASNYVESLSDAYKLLTQMRRPVPRGAEDIGSWQTVFTAITCIAVVTNSALICLIYEDLVGEYSVSTRLWLFILFQWTAFLFMAALRAMVPDVPEDVTIQLERTEFLSSKIIDQVPDEMDDNIQEVDEASLGNIKVLVSPAGSPRAAEGQGHVD
eukprot:jgi/Undpi1/11313/HiC_scaffold_30.g13611.m1